jgi:hypothetical protein
MTVKMANLLATPDVKKKFITKLAVWATGGEYPNRKVLCCLDNPDSKRRYPVSDGKRPRLSVLSDLKIKIGGRTFMFGFYEQAHNTQPRVPRYWWHSKSGGDWRVGLGHDDDGTSNDGRIRKGSDEMKGYTFETVLPFHLDKRLRSITHDVKAEDTYEIPAYWDYLTLPKYYARHGAKCPSNVKDDRYLGALLSYASTYDSTLKVPRGDGTYYASLGSFFSDKANGIMAAYTRADIGHSYISSAAAPSLLLDTRLRGQIGTTYLKDPQLYSVNPGLNTTAHKEQIAHKRSSLMAKLLAQAKLRTQETKATTTYDLLLKRCTFYRIKICIPQLPNLWLEYGVMNYSETYKRRNKPQITTKPVWIRNVYVTPENGAYLNTFGGAKQHVTQLSFLPQKPFDYASQAGFDKNENEQWDYTRGTIPKPKGRTYVSLTGFNERFSPLVRALKAHHGIACSYRVGSREEPTADGLFLKLVEYVTEALEIYDEESKESPAHHKRCRDTLAALSQHGTTIRKFSIILSSVFLRNALPGDQTNSFSSPTKINPTRIRGSSMFGYFVFALFHFAGKLTSAEWANVSLNHPDHAILRSVRTLRLGDTYKDVYKRGKTGTLGVGDYWRVFLLLKRDFMGKMSTEDLPL